MKNHVIFAIPMNYDKYENLEISVDGMEYGFVSIGRKGTFSKLIQFTPMSITGMYNMALLDIQDDGSYSDKSISDNGDRNKILATVYSVVHNFFFQSPECLIFFTGSTDSRTRLYRMAITLNLEILQNDFDIIGVLRDLDSYVYVPFEKNVNYYGFLIKRK